MSDGVHGEPGAQGAERWAGLVGTVLADRYRILQLLGEGAMGAVYLGEHLKIGRRDAIKVLRDSLHTDRESMARFMRGARNLSAIHHANVCTIYDFGETPDGLQFLAMELIQGESLKDLLEREGPLPVPRALRIAEQVADALQAAHDAGIVHRDLKPGNIMIMRDREGGDLVKVVDFDIAKGPEETDTSEVTRLGFVVGTPEYMSPEQLMGERLDGRSDLYSLGIVLFRMLTGLLPFRGDSAQEIMIQRLTHQPLRLVEAHPGLHFADALQPVLDRSLQRKAADRQAGTAEFKRELFAALTPVAPAGSFYGAPPVDVAATVALPAAPAGSAALAGATAQGTWAGAATTASRAASATQLPMDGAPGAPGNAGATAVSSPRSRMLLVGGGVLGALALVVVVILWATGGTPANDPASASDPVAVQTGTVNNSGVGAIPPTAPPPPPAAADPVAQGGVGAAVGGAGNPPLDNSGTGSAGRQAGAATPSAAPAAPPPAPVLAVSDIRITPNAAEDMLFQMFDRVMGPPNPTRAAAVGIRDTARAIFETPGINTNDRALAAHVAGNAFLVLGDTTRAVEWLEQAVNLRPDHQGYRALYDLHRRNLR